MDFGEFVRRLDRAGKRARALAQEVVIDELPSDILYMLPKIDDPRGRRGPPGTIKFFGGRFVTPDELSDVPARRAAKLLWIDGKVPRWINVMVVAADAQVTRVRLLSSGDLVVADASTLPRDVSYAVDPGDPIEPFRIRGPLLPPRWRSLELDGRFHLSASPKLE